VDDAWRLQLDPQRATCSDIAAVFLLDLLVCGITFAAAVFVDLGAAIEGDHSRRQVLDSAEQALVEREDIGSPPPSWVAGV
jgi:hypothetical protein